MSTLKRTAESIFEAGGFIRKLDNLGFRDLPHKISAHRLPHRQANHFLYTFDVPTKALVDINDELHRDIDVIRNQIYKIQEIEPHDCTLERELVPPAYRKDVQKLLELSKKKKKKQWDSRTGLDYYPFQR